MFPVSIMRRTPALIIGGGPAGAAAAIRLAQARAPHLLIERSRTTGDALCGGFLSWRTLETIQALGIDPDTLNPSALRNARLFVGDKMAQAPLPRAAKGVSRHRLDRVMLAHAEAQGAAIERGVGAQSIEGKAARLHDGDEIMADAIFLASGKRELRGLARPPEAQEADPSLGLRLRLESSAGLHRLIDQAIELHLFDRGYAGLNLQEDGTGNLCLAVHRSRLQEAGSPERLIADIGRECPRLGERLAWARPGPIDAVANVPYGWRQQGGIADLFRLGDQAGVIPSLAGEGMGIAIASGIRAANCYVREGGSGSIGYQRALARDLARPIGLALLIRSAAEAPRLAPMLVTFAKIAPIMIDIAARLTRITHSTIDAPRAAKESSPAWNI